MHLIFLLSYFESLNLSDCDTVYLTLGFRL